jgi:hypothetical protein
LTKGLSTAAALLLLVAVVVGCSGDRKIVKHVNAKANAAMELPARDTYALGSAIAASGAVLQDATIDSILRGQEGFLSVDVASASTDATIEVKWLSADGAVERSEARHVPEGARYAAFSTGVTSRWLRGPHRAIVIINGRKVTERLFSVL